MCVELFAHEGWKQSTDKGKGPLAPVEELEEFLGRKPTQEEIRDFLGIIGLLRMTYRVGRYRLILLDFAGYRWISLDIAGYRLIYLRNNLSRSRFHSNYSNCNCSPTLYSPGGTSNDWKGNRQTEEGQQGGQRIYKGEKRCSRRRSR